MTYLFSIVAMYLSLSVTARIDMTSLFIEIDDSSSSSPCIVLIPRLAFATSSFEASKTACKLQMLLLVTTRSTDVNPHVTRSIDATTKFTIHA